MRSIDHYLICLAAALALPLALSARPQTIPSTGTSSKGAYSLEMEIITPKQIEAYQRGEPPSGIILKTGETLEGFLEPQTSIPNYEIAWTTITCGGAVSGGGNIEVESSCGSVAGTSEGGDYELTIGLIRESGGVFSDGFESGNASAWSSVVE